MKSQALLKVKVLPQARESIWKLRVKVGYTSWNSLFVGDFWLLSYYLANVVLVIVQINFRIVSFLEN